MVPTDTNSPPPLSIDHEAFARELRALRAEVDAQIDHRDFLHLKKLERWGRLCTAAGYATAWIAPNPISAYLISQGNTCRWTILMHHVGHRGLDRGADAPERYTSKGFAVGARRFVDWFDWILPEAWRYEHNMLHHYHTGEQEDPDLVEVNMQGVREAPLPLVVKYGIVAFYACTWKLTYYAPKTFFVLQEEKRRKAASSASAPEPEGERGDYLSLFSPLHADGRAFWKSCILPYATARFGVIPALFLPLGPLAVGNVFLNSMAAEVMTNLHSFMIIVPNHAGEDLYRFDERIQGKADFYVRQVVGSTNYHTGSDVLDFLQGFLNYQIEHHLFPDLPPRKYQEIQPRVKALCEKYGIPYVQESVFRRVKKVVDVMVGKASMRKMAARVKRAERAPDLQETEAGASG